MKLPFLHRFIIQRIDKTLDDRAVPGPMLCFFMRLDDVAAKYYHERLLLDRRLNTDLAPFLGCPKNRTGVESTELASNDWSNTDHRVQSWRARLAAACVVVLLGLTFAFNFCIVSPYRSAPSPTTGVHNPSVVDNTEANRNLTQSGSNFPNAGSSCETHQTSQASRSVVARDKEGERDVMEVAVSLLLLPESNMLFETNQLMTQDETSPVANQDATGSGQLSQAEATRDSQATSGPEVSVLREVAQSNPLTKYIMDRCIVPVFVSP